MNALYNYQLFAQAIVLYFAMFWTIVLIGKFVTFLICAGLRNEAYNILMRFYVYPAISWAIFFWLMKAQF